jgi:glycosyltransferase involved in cell wall biosynthesis
VHGIAGPVDQLVVQRGSRRPPSDSSLPTGHYLVDLSHSDRSLDRLDAQSFERHSLGGGFQGLYDRRRLSGGSLGAVCLSLDRKADGALRMYAERYPKVPNSHWTTISNGYDDEDFTTVEQRLITSPVGRTDQIVLIHSGVLYPAERDPSVFFSAVAKLRKDGKIGSSTVKIVLRASGNENSYRGQLREKQIDDIIRLEPPIPYRDALEEMMRSDGLLIFQASNCNHQIPAKIYEYFRTGLPIFALTDPAGDTADALKAVGGHTIARLDSEEEIAQGLLAFMALIQKSRSSTVRNRDIERYSRRFQAGELVNLLDSVL